MNALTTITRNGSFVSDNLTVKPFAGLEAGTEAETGFTGLHSADLRQVGQIGSRRDPRLDWDLLVRLGEDDWEPPAAS